MQLDALVSALRIAPDDPNVRRALDLLRPLDERLHAATAALTRENGRRQPERVRAQKQPPPGGGGGSPAGRIALRSRGGPGRVVAHGGRRSQVQR